MLKTQKLLTVFSLEIKDDTSLTAKAYPKLQSEPRSSSMVLPVSKYSLEKLNSGKKMLQENINPKGSINLKINNIERPIKTKIKSIFSPSSSSDSDDSTPMVTTMKCPTTTSKIINKNLKLGTISLHMPTKNSSSSSSYDSSSSSSSSSSYDSSSSSSSSSSYDSSSSSSSSSSYDSSSSSSSSSSYDSSSSSSSSSSHDSTRRSSFSSSFSPFGSDISTPDSERKHNRLKRLKPSSDSDKKNLKKINKSLESSKTDSKQIDKNNKENKKESPTPKLLTTYASLSNDASPKCIANSKPQSRSDLPGKLHRSLKYSTKSPNLCQKVLEKSIKTKKFISSHLNMMNVAKNSKTKRLYLPEDSINRDKFMLTPMNRSITNTKIKTTNFKLFPNSSSKSTDSLFPSLKERNQEEVIQKNAYTKDTNSSSESSSSNSTYSSSCSSCSGSESSSSDSENTSTSGGKSGNPSSDSDKKPLQKKKNVSITPKGKTDAIEVDKNKDKLKKTQPPKPSTVYSSDTDDSSPKPNAKRKPQPKPKSSATVTPVPKNPKTISKNAPKKLNPPRKVAQKNVTSKDSIKPSINKMSDPKKSKTKSIFSPDNSSDSDDHSSTPPPPKLIAMKTLASRSLKTKSKPKPSITVQSRSSSVSSNSTSNSSNSQNSSDSSRSTRSSSDSNQDSGRSKQGSTKKKHPIKREKSPPPPQLVSDADSAGPTRKQTRSLSSRKSKHVMPRLHSESDSDTGSKTSITKSPVKKAPKESFVQRKIISDEEEERKCPMEGCDSTGHLGGRISRHFTTDACPLYHNLTPHHCKEAYLDRLKKEDERKKAIAIMKSVRGGSPTPEQKAYKEKIKEMRSISGSGYEIKLEEEEDGKERQLALGKHSNKYDLKLFQDAQAVASEAIEEELKLLANVRYTKLIEMGKFEMEVWYQSPYPEDFARLPKLYICEYCLRYMKERKSMERHAAKCVWRHPPGEEVYRKEKISVWEVDGKRYKSYCQNLCLLAKFFLDHKTLYYDVEPFFFYVMTIGDSEGCHTVGYFSKEKNSFLNYNVSCILTLPPYQRQGYGRLLIDFSYLLTRVEGKIGSPEKPLSDLGLISYRSYWKDVLLDYLCNLEGKQISIKDISQEMGINSYDIVSTLQALGMMKYWKGKHIILKKQDVIEEYIDRSKRRGVTYKEIDPNFLKWTPFVPPSTSNSSS